jgi:L-ascorbate 6-phosphate lactonase
MITFADSSFCFLGQSGVLIRCDGKCIAIDPYLSDAVAKSFGSHLFRKTQPQLELIKSLIIDYVFVTHDHLDHCDPESLLILLEQNPQILIYGPESVHEKLAHHKILLNKLIVISDKKLPLFENTIVHIIPAAHTTLKYNSMGLSECMGYIFEFSKKTIYHAGDTIPNFDTINSVKAFGAVDIAFLPCNERNFYRESQGIIGNMTIREMFQFAKDINARKICPIHWDMFDLNSVFPMEIKMLYDLLNEKTPMIIPEYREVYKI